MRIWQNILLIFWAFLLLQGSLNAENISFSLYVCNENHTNLTPAVNYTISLIGEDSVYAVLDNSTGSTMAKTDSNGRIVLNNSNIIPYHIYTVNIIDSTNTYIMSMEKYITYDNVIDICTVDEDVSQPTLLRTIITYALNHFYLLGIIYLGFALMLIKLFRVAKGLIIFGFMELLPAFLILDFLSPTMRLWVVGIGIFSIMVGISLSRFSWGKR